MSIFNTSPEAVSMPNSFSLLRAAQKNRCEALCYEAGGTRRGFPSPQRIESHQNVLPILSQYLRDFSDEHTSARLESCPRADAASVARMERSEIRGGIDASRQPRITLRSI